MTKFDIENNVEKLPDLPGCWIWSAGVSSNGYPNSSDNKRVNRESYRLFKSAIPDGMWVLHRCDLPLCVNPNHLFLGTPKDNYDDMVKKGRRGNPTNRGYRKPYCKRGHPRTPDNLNYEGKCIICKNKCSRKSKLKTKSRMM